MGTMTLNRGVCWVVAEGNDMLLYGPNGEELPAQESLVATADMADGVATATVSFVCNIASTKAEMMAKIEMLTKKSGDIVEEWDKARVAAVQAKLKRNRMLDWLKELIASK